MTLIRDSLFYITTIAFYMLVGCSSTNKTQYPPSMSQFPPEVSNWPINDTLFANKDFESIDLFLNKVVQEDSAEATHWWADYRRAQLWAQKDKKISCENFTRLAMQPRFPLSRLAYLRAHELCPKNYIVTSRLKAYDKESFDPWLSRLSQDVAIKTARAKKDYKELIQLLWDKSKLNLPKREKASLTEEARKLAKKHGDKTQVRRLTQRLHQLAPSKDPKPASRDYLAVAKDHRYYRNFDSARRYYNKVIKGSRFSVSQKIAAYRGIRQTYKVQQRRPEAVRATENLAKYTEKYLLKSKGRMWDHQTFVDNHLILARTLWTENYKTKAKKVLDKIENRSGKYIPMFQVNWIRGRMSDEESDFNNAQLFYEKALQDKEMPQGFREKLEWHQAWALRKLKAGDKAIKAFEDLVKNADNPYDRARYRFWLGRTYADNDEIGDAEDEYEEIIDELPHHYYGFLAHRELEKELPEIDNKDFNGLSIKKAPPKALAKHLIRPYMEWLIAVREDKVAKDYLLHLGQFLKAEKGSDQVESWAYLFDYYSRSGNYQQLFGELYKTPKEIRDTLLSEYSQLIYPQPYRDFVSSSANRFGISLEFIYSIMRQESAFDPNARSHMDAFGLMQLLPQVARKSARAHSIQFSKAEDLYEPHVNIPLGSAHLRKLWDKYNGDFVLAVASYNASEQAIEGWLKTRYRGDTLEFIEDIPYEETKQYVKLVMRNYIAYQIIGASENKVHFPEWALRIRQDKRSTASK